MPKRKPRPRARPLATPASARSRLPVDAARLRMGNTYSSAPAFYEDRDFVCRDCGVAQTWTAAQQKWWYEDAAVRELDLVFVCADVRDDRRGPGAGPADRVIPAAADQRERAREPPPASRQLHPASIHRGLVSEIRPLTKGPGPVIVVVIRGVAGRGGVAAALPTGCPQPTDAPGRGGGGAGDGLESDAMARPAASKST